MGSIVSVVLASWLTAAFAAPAAAAAIAPAAAPVKVPVTPAGQAFSEWLAAFNSAQPPKIQEMLKRFREPRPLEETVQATLDWALSGEAPAEAPAGVPRSNSSPSAGLPSLPCHAHAPVLRR